MPTDGADYAESALPKAGVFDEDFVALLEEQERRQQEKSRKANLVIFALFGVMMALTTIWYLSSKTNQRKVSDLIVDFKSSDKDFKMIASPSLMATQYDKALSTIGTRSEDIDKASVSLGVDPKSVKEDGMEQEMNGMMGGEGHTVGKRDQLLRGELGVFAGVRKKPDVAGPAVPARQKDANAAPAANKPSGPKVPAQVAQPQPPAR